MSRLSLACCLVAAMLANAATARAENLVVEGAPADTGYNLGSIATIRATLRGVQGDPSRYVVWADISYLGKTAVSSVQLDRKSDRADSRAVPYEGGWLVPADAPTGIYSVTLRVEDRRTDSVVARQRIRGFSTYRKLLRIARLSLDKTFYTVGEALECEIVLQNLTDRELKDLRVEFSNANYPWISLFEGGGDAENPDLALRVLRENLAIPPRGAVTIPMMPAGTAAFLQGAQRAVMGAGALERTEEVPNPEVNQYTVAVWNADRTVLYDMQFTTPAVVRAHDRETPRPYGRNFVHAYLSDMEFTKYREFYPPGYISPVIQLDRSRTMFRPGDPLQVRTELRNPEAEAWKGASLRFEILDSAGAVVHQAEHPARIDLAPGQAVAAGGTPWKIPAAKQAGRYRVVASLNAFGGRELGRATLDFAVNPLPASILIFGAHPDDEQAHAGLIRAAAEAGIPTRAVFFTSGDVGACERYYSKPCGPNEAREFGLVRMEETWAALEHLGLKRENVIFLGLPDGGSGAIWSKHLEASNPFLSIYLATEHAPYENVFRPNLPFARQAVIEVTKQLIREFRPAMIVTGHPDERHVDHRTNNWFVLKACHELLREKQLDPSTEILVDISYGAGGFKPAPYRYEKHVLYLSGEAAALKQEMTWIYQSQDGNMAEGLRRPFAELPREEEHLRILDWAGHEGWNE
jgi:LmbE family N-acetylglucosaminyl deacetylase